MPPTLPVSYSLLPFSPRNSIFPKQPDQIADPRHEQARRHAYVPPRHIVPPPYIQKPLPAQSQPRHDQMPYIRDRQRGDIVPHHFWLRGRVQHRESDEREQAVQVAELEGD